MRKVLTNRVISNTGTVSAWIALGKPPVLRSPSNEAELGNIWAYGFDAYEPLKINIQNYYPTLGKDYRPAFKSIESFSFDRVNIQPETPNSKPETQNSSTPNSKLETRNSSTLTLRDEMGIPAHVSGTEVTVRGAAAGSNRALYAYRALTDSTEEIVGKLNLLSFDKVPNRVHIIAVNGAKTPSQFALEQSLKDIYRQAIAGWTVISEPGVSVSFEGGRMTHEGAGSFSTYNADQSAIVSAFEATGRRIERKDFYLFFVDGAAFKDRSLAGYMPLQRQVGFIYDNPSVEIIAHELGHGAFNLRHPFSPEAFIATEGSTRNLMDYANGSELWIHQWHSVQNPSRILFAWAQDEEEGAYTWKFFGEKFTKLFNHVYDNNKTGSLTYFNKIKTVTDSESFELSYSESEAKKWGKEDKMFIDNWGIGTYDGDKIAKSVFDKIIKAEKDAEIESINLSDNRIYIGSFAVNEKDYLVAVYAPKGAVFGLKKITVTDSKVLEDTDSIKYVYCDETYTKYLIIAFYKDEAEKTDPSLIIQIEKFLGDNTKDKWLEYLGILVEEEGEIIPTLVCESGYCCAVCGADLTVTKEKLDLIFPTGNNITPTLAGYFNTALKTAGFNTCKSHVHFFAQCYVETKGYTELAENPNYRYEGVLELHNQKNDAKLFFNQGFFDNNTHLDYFHFKVYKNLGDSTGNYTGQNYKTFKWRSSANDTVRVPAGGDAAYKFTKGKGTFDIVNFSKSEKISRNRQLFSIIYANKYENGSPSTEDGYNYRGQGAIHLTWKENYRHAQTYAKELFNEDFDWVNHPEYLVNNEKDAVYSAVTYFYFRLKKDINKLNEWDIDKVSYNVNGGYNGLPQRQTQYTRLSTQVYKLSECKTKNTDE